MYIKYKSGPKIYPCGTSHIMFWKPDLVFQHIVYVQSDNLETIYLQYRVFPKMRMSCLITSKALDKSQKKLTLCIYEGLNY